MFTKDDRIITSLLDTDLYKFTMQQVVLSRFPTAQVEYKFQCRNRKDLTPFIREIEQEIDHLCTLTFTKDELAYLRTLPYLKPEYVNFLEGFKLNRNNVNVTIENGELSIRISGSWFHTILFEVPILAIINEIYMRNKSASYFAGRDRLSQKVSLIQRNEIPFSFVDFGTRRRYSKLWQEEVVRTFKEKVPESFNGTSNVLLAKKYDLKPVGTMAHEFLQAAQGLGPRIRDSQKFALDTWAQEYRGQLGIALSDVVGMDAFLRDFDLYFAKLFDGCRHDSGDPKEWGYKLINHYKQLGIDPTRKIAVFSDGLTVTSALELNREFHGKLITSFGIGTSLTNDMALETLQIVIKMVKCNGQPVAKISDSSGKQMCENDSYLAYLRDVFQIGDKNDS